MFYIQGCQFLVNACQFLVRASISEVHSWGSEQLLGSLEVPVLAVFGVVIGQ